MPGDYEFAETLVNLPSFYRQEASKTCETLHLLQKNPNHVPELVTGNTLQEYLLGGEADQFVEYIDGYDVSDQPEEDEENGDLSIPWELSDEWLGSI